ncbi:dihydrolipoamide acetyltransferase family protein [Aestuariicoccus sp. MJ-SS9]|uniref:dihydrolipoamide acetyltransferase family protein n=1 Tax=Aestuariicoccus sp. MJ-SS9 TaxID=3079855 RepID=UPI00290F0AEC|nr:dihydrolipoamide acetyltransferase family protein [Aestuariicoccus sp. MJ-SS9]MDU8911642.1 dihydrolipoamide acetyltransferase family protein [Aestuariicoccus sp. MJ-SS9]
MSVFTLPDLGEGLTDAEIVAWHVSEGDRVMADQPLLSVETDKAVVEIPAPGPGIVTRLIAAVGDIVPTGGALAEIDPEAGKDAGAIVGDLGAARTPAERQPARERGVGPGAIAPESGPDAGDPGKSPRPAASPAVRKLARDKGVDLAGVAGSGPGGAVLSADVLAVARGPGDALRGARRAMARAMERSRAAVVPATIMDHAVIDAWPATEDPTLRLIRAVTSACRDEPALNAWFDGDRRQLFDHVDLTIAVDTPDGLFTPVLRNADSDPDIRTSLNRLKAAVRDRSIPPEALRGGTFTLSNFGTLGGTHAVLVVSPPQVAILGAGRMTDRVILKGGQPVAQRVLPLSLTFDHRVVTGGEAARFLAALRADLETPPPPSEE